MNFKSLFKSSLLSALIFGSVSSYSAQTAFSVIYANFYTSNPKNPIAEAVATDENGRIVFVGSKDDAQEYVDDFTRVQELDKNLFITAGLGDARTFAAYGSYLEQKGFRIDFNDDLLAIRKKLKQHILNNPDYDLYTGFGFNSEKYADIGPLSSMIDDLTQKSVDLISVGHNIHWLNSAALKRFGIDSDTKDVRGGIIERYDNGKPSGTLRGNACMNSTSLLSVKNAVPALEETPVELVKDGIRRYERYAIQDGEIMISDPHLIVNGDDVYLKALRQMDAQGELQLHWVGGIPFSIDDDIEQNINRALKLYKENIGGNFELNCVEVMVDGNIVNGLMALLKPYSQNPWNIKGEYYGHLNYDRKALCRIICAMNAEGISVRMVASGDLAVRTALDAFEDAKGILGESYLSTNSIGSIVICDESDKHRFSELNITAVTNTYYFNKSMTIYRKIGEKYLGKERLNQGFPLKSILNTGANIAASSDYPLVPFDSNLIDAVKLGVTRGTDEGSITEESVNVEDMINACTIGIARMLGIDKDYGSIEVGKIADLVVFSRDFTKVDPVDIGSAHVIASILKGELKTIGECEN